MAAYTIINTM